MLKRNQSLNRILVIFFVVSIIFASSSFFQNLDIDVLDQSVKDPKLLSPSNNSEANDLSKTILDKYKHRVLEHLFNNKTIASTISNSSIPIPVSIVVGVISPNVLKYLHMVIFPKPILRQLMEIQYLTYDL